MSVTLKDVGSGFKRTAINENFNTIESTLNSEVLLKNGSQQLEADLDFNSNKGINVARGVLPTDSVNFQQLTEVVEGSGTLATDTSQITHDVGGSPQLLSTYLKRPVKNMSTLAEAVADVGLVEGDSVYLAERTAGNGGGAMWDVVLSSTVTENTFSIVQCVGVATLSLVLRQKAHHDVREFGITGVGDESAGMQVAFDYSRKLSLEAEVGYTLSSDISRSGDFDLIGNNASFTMTGCRVTVGGSLGSYVSLSNDITGGTSSFTLTTLTVAKGDLLKIYENVDFSWAGDDATARVGDILEVARVDGDTVHVKGLINDSYTSANGLIALMDPAKVKLENINMAENGTENLVLNLEYGRDCKLDNVKVEGGAQRAIFIESCYRTELTNCEGINRSAASGAQYGLSLSENKQLVVDGGYYFGTRHGTHIGNSGGGISRDYTIKNSIIQNDKDLVVELYAADIHSAAYNIEYRSNTILGGGALAGKNASYIDNDIYAIEGVTNYQSINVANITSGKFLVQGNRFYPSGGSAQFSIIGPSSNAKLANLKGDYTLLVKDNEFTLNSGSVWIMQIGVNNDTAGGYRAEFIIDGVTLRDTPASFQGIYQYVHFGTGVTLYPYSLIVRNVYNVLELPSTATLLEIQDLPTNVQELTNIELPKFIFKQAFAVGAGAHSKQTTQSLPCIWSNRTNAVKVTATADVIAFDGAATMWADAVMASGSTLTMRLTTGNSGETVTAGGTYGGTYVVGG